MAATPFNYEEQIICLLIMVCGASFRETRRIICGLAASMSPEKKEFQVDMSDLNLLSVRISSVVARYRYVMHHSKYLRCTRGRDAVKLSPGIAAELALQEAMA